MLLSLGLIIFDKLLGRVEGMTGKKKNASVRCGHQGSLCPSSVMLCRAGQGAAGQESRMIFTEMSLDPDTEPSL